MKWKVRIAWGITIAIILAIGILLEWQAGRHIAWTLCKLPCKSLAGLTSQILMPRQT